MKKLLTAEQLAQALDDLFGAVASGISPGLREKEPLAIIGIRTRGEILAERLAAHLAGDKKRTGLIARGVLDITFYRDDLSRRKGAPLVRATEIDFDLDDLTVLLVDDVLHTGRSVRAAMDAIMDFGRPRAIRLAVLIDRGGRELPVAADFVGRHLEVPDDVRVQLHLTEHDGEDGAFLVKGGKRR